MDPEFVRVTARVFAIGLTVLTLGTVALYIAFRRFGRSESSSDFQPFAVLLSAALFILICCIILLRLSVVR